jgi:phage terminase large subunit-like protein
VTVLSPPPQSPAEHAAAALAARAAEEAWTDEQVEQAFQQIVAAHPQGTELLRSWRDWWARPEQLPPGTRNAALDEDAWRWWGIITGRGYGKTRSAGEFIADRAEAFAATKTVHRCGLIAPTAADARDTMVEGESGIMAICERRKIPAHYEPSKRRVTIMVDRQYPTLATTFSAEEPERLRGPQHHTTWLEEFAAWARKVDPSGNTAWTNADLGMRLRCPKGLRPQGVITTTPKPVPDVEELIARGEDKADSSVVLTRGALYANLRNLDDAFVQAILDRYEGTQLGLQEIMGLVLGIREGALWTPDQLNHERVGPKETAAAIASVDRIVVGVDPSGGGSAETGIVVVGADLSRSIAYTLEDASIAGPPEVWGARVVQAYHRWNAAKVIGETNYGGDMVRSTIHTVDSTVAFDKVTAKVGKQLRADPVSAIAHRYTDAHPHGRARHVGAFGDLEAQQVSWVPGEESPDRLDAYVYAVTDLLKHLTVAPASAASPNRAGTARTGRTARWQPSGR